MKCFNYVPQTNFWNILFLLFLLFGEAENLVFRSFFCKLNFRVVSVCNVLLVICLTIQDSVNVLQHSFKVLVCHQFSLIF